MKIKQTWREPLEIIATGYPFCIFKYSTGLYLHSLGGLLLESLGIFLLALSLFDLAINTLNLFLPLAQRSRLSFKCSFGWLMDQLFQHADLGDALDMMLSFILVSYMVVSTRVVDLEPVLLTAWNISVMFNVLGAGIFRLADSYGKKWALRE